MESRVGLTQHAEEVSEARIAATSAHILSMQPHQRWLGYRPRLPSPEEAMRNVGRVNIMPEWWWFRSRTAPGPTLPHSANHRHAGSFRTPIGASKLYLIALPSPYTAMLGTLCRKETISQKLIWLRTYTFSTTDSPHSLG